jgi:hypothetical protein
MRSVAVPHLQDVVSDEVNRAVHVMGDVACPVRVHRHDLHASVEHVRVAIPKVVKSAT